MTQLALELPWRSRRVVVGFSGGVTSAWCAGWALRTFPRDEVILLFHDTKEEDPDTYRFLREMAAALGMPITERSDGRSVTEVFRDENYLGNTRNAMCSRILKQEQSDRFIAELRAAGHDKIVKVVGFSKNEPDRVQHAVGKAIQRGWDVRFPCIEENVTKQDCATWCECTMGVRPAAMYAWSDHANCVGCIKGGREYWLAVAANRPDVFNQRADLEDEFGHCIVQGENPIRLRDLLQVGLRRPVARKESISIGTCECGD